MNILAINTSDHLLSVALRRGDHTIHDQLSAERRHNQSILVLIDRLFAAAGMGMGQIDAVAFGVGPGSFTGLRIAAGVAQGIAFGIEVPVVPVSCLAAIAQKQTADRVIVALDAKRSRVFWGRYLRTVGGWVKLDGEEHLTALSELRATGRDWCGAGSGWDLHADQILLNGQLRIANWVAEQTPHAVEIAKLGAVGLMNGEGRDARYAIPIYLSPYQTTLSTVNRRP